MTTWRQPAVIATLLFATVVAPSAAVGQAAPPVRILLDQPPRAVEYQLSRLSNDDLARVERSPEDPKYRPVYGAMLARKGLSRELREEAVGALVKIDRVTAVRVLLDALSTIPADDAATGDLVAAMLIAQPAPSLRSNRDQLTRALEGSASVVLRGAYGALMMADGSADAAWQLASARPGHVGALLHAVSLLPAGASVDPLRETVANLVVRQLLPPRDTDGALRADAIEALAAARPDTAAFRAAAAELMTTTSPELRAAAVRALLRIPEMAWSREEVSPLAQRVLAIIRDAPADRRVTTDGAAAAELADRLGAAMVDPARAAFRRELRALTVRVVTINTIPEQMRYSTSWFVVEAGKPVQIVFVNADSMPHNLVIGRPGSLKELGTAAMAMAAPASPGAKPYVPASPLVLRATNLLNERETERMSFTAPAPAGAYVYLCTFPGHWLRMYGVMLVVDNLESWEATPKPPADPMTNQPFGSQR